jgi:hypothetical protein
VEKTFPMGRSRQRPALGPLSNFLALKILTARPAGKWRSTATQSRVTERADAMQTEKTCAACDCKLDDSAIKVKLGGKTVEVCCDECARQLKEAHSSAGQQ